MFKDTKHKIIALTYVVVAIYKFNKVEGGKIILPDAITKNKNVVTYPFDNNLCFWACIYQFKNQKHPELDRCKKEINNLIRNLNQSLKLSNLQI